MRSPSSTSAIGPPSFASGPTYPMAGPWVAPENRPSVISAQVSESPMPTSAEVAPSISRMPGPPRGPSLRMMIAVPASIEPARMASIAVSSSSKTRAVPVKLHIDGATPDALTTAPSGASEPRRMKIAPSGAMRVVAAVQELGVQVLGLRRDLAGGLPRDGHGRAVDQVAELAEHGGYAAGRRRAR